MILKCNNFNIHLKCKNQFFKQHQLSIIFSAQSVNVTINIFLLNHTVCNQPLIRINEINLPWFSFKEPARVLPRSLGRISFIHHLYLKCVFSILEDPENLPVSLLYCSCSLPQTSHSSGTFLLNPPCVCKIFLRGRPSLLNPMDFGGHICCMHPLEWIILGVCWNLPNGFNCFQQLVQPDSVGQWRDAEPEVTAEVYMENEVFQQKRTQKMILLS